MLPVSGIFLGQFIEAESIISLNFYYSNSPFQCHQTLSLEYLSQEPCFYTPWNTFYLLVVYLLVDIRQPDHGWVREGMKGNSAGIPRHSLCLVWFDAESMEEKSDKLYSTLRDCYLL